MRDDKRLLINLVFSELTLKNDKITANYSEAFKILSELINKTNTLDASSKKNITQRITARIFEPKKKVDFTIQSGDFYPHRPIVLREPYYLIPIDYAPAVQPMFNVGYFGEMKQRWEEIQRLQHTRSQII